MTYYKSLLTASFALLLASCNLVGGVSDALSSNDPQNFQDISVSSILNGDENVPAKCDITHKNFTYYKAITPFSMHVRKSHHPLIIKCDYKKFTSGRIRVLSIDGNKYEKNHMPTTQTRWKNEHHRPDWVYPAIINIPLNDFEGFQNQDDYYPDNAVPADIYLSRNAGKML